VTQRAGDPAGSVIGVPRPHPGADSLFQIGDDPVCNSAVNISEFGHFPFSFGLEVQLV
jgi:hypothetical protein